MYGAPGAIRTPDRLVRSQVLYPTELRARRSGALYRFTRIFQINYLFIMESKQKIVTIFLDFNNLVSKKWRRDGLLVLRPRPSGQPHFVSLFRLVFARRSNRLIHRGFKSSLRIKRKRTTRVRFRLMGEREGLLGLRPRPFGAAALRLAFH